MSIVQSTRHPMRLAIGDVIVAYPDADHPERLGAPGEWTVMSTPRADGDRVRIDYTDAAGEDGMFTLGPLTRVSIDQDLSERRRVIDGMRELAAYLEEHPDVPVAAWQRISYFPREEPVGAALAEVDRIAGVLGSEVGRGVHYRAERWFGPVEYAAIVCDWPGRKDAEAAQAEADAESVVA